MEASVELFASRMNFNSRPSARGDQTTSGLRTAEIFQFTPLREGRRLQVEQNSLNTLFQFTPLREGRRTGAGCCSCRWR